MIKNNPYRKSCDDKDYLKRNYVSEIQDMFNESLQRLSINRQPYSMKCLFDPKKSKNSSKIIEPVYKEQQFLKTKKSEPKLFMTNKYDFNESNLFQKIQVNDLKYLKKFYQYFKKLPLKKQQSYKFQNKVKDGSMVSHFAVWYQNEELVKFLLSQKIDFNIPNNEGVTPLMLSCFNSGKNQNLQEIILENSKNLNSIDNKGYTALHYAAISNNIHIIKKLLEKQDINPYQQNNEGKLFIDLAKEPAKIKILMQNLTENRPTIFQKLKVKIQDSSSQIFSPESEMDGQQTQALQKPNFKKKSNQQIEIKSVKSKYKESQCSLLSPINEFSLNSYSPITIEDFIIHSLIGQGSFGSVFLAQEKKTGRFYAIKALLKELIINENLIDYAFTEKLILMNIKHPFIVKLHYAFQNQTFLFLVMDFHPGKDLSYYIQYKFKEYFQLENIKKYFCEILLALEELHKFHIIFRDLKPENIILDCEGHIKLIDFGLAKVNVKDQKKGGESFCGSHAYLAPEMIKKQGHGKAIDYYALGKPPFYNDDKDIMLKNVLNQELILPKNIDGKLANLLRGLLEKNLEKRLGYKNGFLDIKNHPWLEDVDWMNVYQRKYQMKMPDQNIMKLFTDPCQLKQLMDPNKLQNWTFLNSENNQLNQLYFQINFFFLINY